MVDPRLVQMEELDLIKSQSNGNFAIVSRDREWLQERGILPYDKLNGVEILRREYERLLNMKPRRDMAGLDELFRVAKESRGVEPTGPGLTQTMCEVYVRLRNLFPLKSDSWRKTETLLYFGRTIG